MWGNMDDIERLGRYLLTMRLGAIDVGSNSVHMIVADVSREGHLEVVDRVKEMVRLGRRSFTTGTSHEESMDMAVHALTNFSGCCECGAWAGCARLPPARCARRATATEFIRRIKRETGLTRRSDFRPRRGPADFPGRSPCARPRGRASSAGRRRRRQRRIGAGARRQAAVDAQREAGRRAADRAFLLDDPPTARAVEPSSRSISSADRPADAEGAARRRDPRDRHLGHDQHSGRDGAIVARRGAGPICTAQARRRTKFADL